MTDSTHDHAKATGTSTRTGKSKAGGIDVDLAALTVRVTALEAKAHVHVEPPPPPPPDPIPVPPPNQKVAQFPISGTAASFATLAKDFSIDVIEIAGGTYPKWAAFLDVARPADRPLLIRPAPGAAVIWDGTGTDNAPPWRIGWASLLSYVTWDPAGTGGSFTIQNYPIGAIGLVTARYFDHVAFNGVTVRGCYGTGTPQVSHVVYVSTSNEGSMSGNPRSKYWTSNDWDVVGPSNRNLCGFQTEHAPCADHVTANRWKVRSLHRASFVYADPTDVKIDGWDIADCNATIDNYYANQAQGVVSNCHAVNSGPMAPGQGSWKVGPLLSGGGNTAAA